MRGTFKFVQSEKVKKVPAITWWDSKPFLFLGTGSDLDRDVRREKSGEQHEFPCPKAVKDYHKNMGGVDVHDQLRFQGYSLQRAVIFRKNYKSLFFGLVDLAIFNGYFAHCAYPAGKTTRLFTYAQYIRKLHLERITIKDADMFEGNAFDTAPTPMIADTSAAATANATSDAVRPNQLDAP
ncbi:hypothetical protein PC110_g7290 [Phytophthora cactorum]|uniref:PiggyBac transposable element-derived protein domain-containing protein n=1 Tax=Phytophthora cactorum TaxID=29920 RepID=A0A329SI89_9STRA|nr:hypothetical protein PC110_g7290 [Phytophthora cactorum]